MRLWRSWVVAAALLLSAARAVYAHGELFRVGSSASGSGALVAELNFENGELFPLEPSVTIGGSTLYTAIFPSFAWVTAPSPSAFPLRPRTQVNVEVVAISSGLVIKIGSARADAVGEQVSLGEVSTDPDAHVHPEWQVLVPEGSSRDLEVTFRLTTHISGYMSSANHTVNFRTNAAIATATVTATRTATPSPEPTPSVADPNCDTQLTAADAVAIVAVLAGAPEICSADINGDQSVDAADLEQFPIVLF